MTPDNLLINLLARIDDVVSDLRDILLSDIRSNTQYKNPLNLFGKKVFSQTDEDGITLEILRRLGIDQGSFIEFGVGNGLENNTLVLAALKWRGFWVDGCDTVLNLQKVDNPKFAIMKRIVTVDNLDDTVIQGMSYTGINTVDLISFDFEGNDYYLIKRLLEIDIKPKVWIVEFNGKFIPPIEWKVEYQTDYAWDFNDYFGASLTSYQKLFAKHGYFLVCCNGFTGSNAWFVSSEFKHLFTDVPEKIDDIWVEPRYYLPRKYGHVSSTKTIEQILNGLNLS